MAFCFLSIRGCLSHCRTWGVFWELLSVCCSSFCHLLKFYCQTAQTERGPCQVRSTISQKRLGRVLAGTVHWKSKSKIEENLSVYWINFSGKLVEKKINQFIHQRYRNKRNGGKINLPDSVLDDSTAHQWEVQCSGKLLMVLEGRGFSMMNYLPGSSFGRLLLLPLNNSLLDD